MYHVFLLPDPWATGGAEAVHAVVGRHRLAFVRYAEAHGPSYAPALRQMAAVAAHAFAPHLGGCVPV